MARSSAATVAPPAKRRKPAHSAPRHASTQTPRRRSSGPAKRGATSAPKRPRAAAGAASAPAAAPRTTPTAPRRKAASAPLAQRLLASRLLDRLLRGRACVALVFALLVGIVFFNVSLLEMNEGIARTNAKATALEHENAKLRSQVAPLGSSERIQREAIKRGYSLPAAGDVGYITGDTNKNAELAAERMVAPGMGEGTASRTSEEVQAETATETETGVAPAPVPEPVTPTPTPTAPVSATPTAPTAATVP